VSSGQVSDVVVGVVGVVGAVGVLLLLLAEVAEICRKVSVVDLSGRRRYS